MRDCIFARSLGEFFLDNLPSICIGVGEMHAGPPEPWLAAYPHKQMAGHAPLAQHLIEQAFADGFEPSVSYKLALDEAFDRECLQHLASGNCAALLKFLDQRLPAAGNGAAEMRNWLAAHGAAGARGFDLIHYSAMPEIYVGCGLASWVV